MIATLIFAAVVTMGTKDKPAAEYRHDAAQFKPYVVQLYTPSGVAVLRDMVPDHKHHHGLMFAVGAAGVDCWSETAKCGREVERQFNSNATGITQQLDWTASDGTVVLHENRAVQVMPVRGVTLLTWRSGLEPPPGKAEVNLTGSHYFGLGARFVPAMDKVGTFINSGNATGVVVRGTEKVTPANWCAYIAPVDGKPVTFAMFDAPTNPRHPAHFFTMTAPFAYLSATLNLWKEPYVLQKPLDLCYGVALWDGEQTAEQIDKVYRQWTKENSKHE